MLRLSGTVCVFEPAVSTAWLAVRRGLEVAAVDHLRAESGPQILEVISSPGPEGVESLTGFDVAGAMMEKVAPVMVKTGRTLWKSAETGECRRDSFLPKAVNPLPCRR